VMQKESTGRKPLNPAQGFFSNLCPLNGACSRLSLCHWNDLEEVLSASSEFSGR